MFLYECLSLLFSSAIVKHQSSTEIKFPFQEFYTLMLVKICRIVMLISFIPGSATDLLTKEIYFTFASLSPSENRFTNIKNLSFQSTFKAWR